MNELTPAMQKFILHWGEMGTTWGINRTVAQMHALLYLSPQPLTAEEISDALSVARSTVSTGLRELQNWGIVKVVHVLGDRRDHFELISDVWEMFRVLLDERKRRELDPTLELLRESVTELKNGDSGDDHTTEKLQSMLDFIEMVTSFYEQVQKMSTDQIIRIVKLGESARKLLLKATEGK